MTGPAGRVGGAETESGAALGEEPRGGGRGREEGAGPPRSPRSGVGRGRPWRTEDFDYPLPEALIARRPAPRRDEARMLVVHREAPAEGRRLEDRGVRDLPGYLEAGDALVLNDSRVFPARLRGEKPTGARVEVFLLRPLEGGDDDRWEALVRPGGKLKPGREVVVAPGFRVLIEDSLPGGGRVARLEGEDDPWRLVERHGRVPLPPYIRRTADARDRERYQTVYAERRGSVAAPTAGLHFTPELLERIRERGVRTVRITLHVGIGTFRPVDADRPADHELHPEWFEVSEEAAETLNRIRAADGRIWAVGTTAVRSLESAAGSGGRLAARRGWTDLFIHPPYRFRAVDGLLTNFHLPRSSLLMLVSAFAGHRLTMEAYRHAISRRYRLYSYGDAMLVR